METKKLRRIRRIIFLWIFNHFCSRYTHLWKFKNLILNLACISTGVNTRVVGPIHIGSAAILAVGDGTWLGTDFYVYGSGQCNIGSNCDIAPNVKIITGSHLIGDSSRRAGQGLHYTVCIGDGCWGGANSSIYGDTVIGDSSIIAVGAIVNKTVKSNCIVGGIPAHIIRDLDN